MWLSQSRSKKSILAQAPRVSSLFLRMLSRIGVGGDSAVVTFGGRVDLEVTKVTLYLSAMLRGHDRRHPNLVPVRQFCFFCVFVVTQGGNLSMRYYLHKKDEQVQPIINSAMISDRGLPRPRCSLGSENEAGRHYVNPQVKGQFFSASGSRFG